MTFDSIEDMNEDELDATTKRITSKEDFRFTDDYLTAAMKSQIESLNPLTMRDRWSKMTAKDPIYESLSFYHEESKKVIPWIAMDWSPIEASGSGVFDPNNTYIDPDNSTVANEAIPSNDLEVIVRIRENISFHRSENWYNPGDYWNSPNSSFQLPGEMMEYVTAHDVVFSAEMLQWSAPQYESGFKPLNQTTLGNSSDITDPNWVRNGGTGMYSGIQMVGNYSIKYDLDEFYSMFYLYSFPLVMSMKVWENHTLLNLGGNNALSWYCGQGGSIEDQKNSIVGTGQFMWTEWDLGTYIKLDTNPDYFCDGSLDVDRPSYVIG